MPICTVLCYKHILIITFIVGLHVFVNSYEQTVHVSRSVRWSHVFYSCTSCVLSLYDAVGVCDTYLASLESAQIACTWLPWPAE